MKVNFHLLLSVFCLLTITESLSAEWMQTNGPFGGGSIVTSLSNGNSIFTVLRQNGVYRSNDNANNWTKLINAPQEINQFATNSNYIYAGSNYGVYRSSDNGDSWAQVSNDIRCIRAVASSGSYVFAMGNSLYASSNYGTSWTSMNFNHSADKLAIGGPCVFAINGSAIYRSFIGGASWSWSCISGSLNNSLIRAFTVKGSNLFAGTDKGLYRSTDYGNSWTAVNTGIEASNIYSLINDGTELIAGISNKGVYRSNDDGENWTPFNEGLPQLAVSELSVNCTDVLAGFKDYGMYRFAQNDVAWRSVNSGLGYRRTWAIAATDSVLYSGGYGIGFFSSIDNGSSWNCLNTDFGNISSIVIKDSLIFALTSFGRSYFSKDKGISWSNLFPADKFIQPIMVDGETLYAGCSNNVIYSIDNGSSWSAGDPGLIGYVTNLLMNNRTLYAGVGSAIYKLPENSTEWIRVNSGFLVGKKVTSLAAIGSKIFVGTDNGIFGSDDGGSNWINQGWGSGISYNIPVNYLLTIGANIFAATPAAGSLFLSTDNGLNWSNVSTGLSFGEIFVMAANSTHLYIGKDKGGVWKRALSEMVVSIDEEKIPPPSILSNYPNPFNPQTQIRYELRNPNFVKLTVYNSKGELVKTLVNVKQPAGCHSISFDGITLNSGIYFYKLETGGRSITNKMLLLR